MTKKQALKKLVDFAMTDKTDVNKIFVIGTVTESQAKMIEAKTGFDLTGYERILDKWAIKHIIKEHGNIKTEASRGQIAVTLADFNNVIEIVKSDNVVFSGKNRAGKNCLLYQAVIGDVFYYIEEIRTGKKQLALNTLYKRKQKNR